MSDLGTTQTTPPDPDEAAAAWFHRLAGASPDEAGDVRHAFERWLAADPDNAEAFARTAAIWREVGAHAATPELMVLREAAIADARNAGAARWRPTPVPRPDRRPALVAAACIGAAVLAGAAYLYFQPIPVQTYTTQIGERHTVTLADNSRVDIDADSTIAVDFTPDRRLVRVLKGQAYFQVEKDAARPFVVQDRGRDVVATGTQFDVEDLDNGVRVTLVDGHVIVRRSAAASDSAALDPNDQWTDIDGAQPSLIHLPSVLSVTAWRQGKLLFDNEPLGSAILRVDRYAGVPVTVDPAVAGIRIGGAFDAGDVRAFVDAVTAAYPVKLEGDRARGFRLVRRTN